MTLHSFLLKYGTKLDSDSEQLQDLEHALQLEAERMERTAVKVSTDGGCIDYIFHAVCYEKESDLQVSHTIDMVLQPENNFAHPIPVHCDACKKLIGYDHN